MTTNHLLTPLSPSLFLGQVALSLRLPTLWPVFLQKLLELVVLSFTISEMEITTWKSLSNFQVSERPDIQNYMLCSHGGDLKGLEKQCPPREPNRQTSLQNSFCSYLSWITWFQWPQTSQNYSGKQKSSMSLCHMCVIFLLSKSKCVC